MKIKFTKSPTGVFDLAYNAGDVANLRNKALCEKLIKEGYALPYKSEKENAGAKGRKKEVIDESQKQTR